VLLANAYFCYSCFSSSSAGGWKKIQKRILSEIWVLKMEIKCFYSNWWDINVHYSFLLQYHETNVNFTWKLFFFEVCTKILEKSADIFLCSYNNNEWEWTWNNNANFFSCILKICIDAAAHNVSCLTNEPMNLLPLRF